MKSIPFNTLAVGQTAQIVRTLAEGDIAMFAAMSGDTNPQHMDAAWSAENTRFDGVIAHGLWTGTLVSTVLGTMLPGPGTIFKRLEFKFRRPVLLGDTVTARVEVMGKTPERQVVAFACEIANQHGDVVLIGEAEVIAPTMALDYEDRPVAFPAVG